MKKILQKRTLFTLIVSIGALCGLLLSLSGGKAVWAATLIVDGTCIDSDSNGVCDDGVTYKTIQAAVDAATAGDTLDVGPATYPERVIIDKALIVTGDPGTPATAGPGADAPIVEGGGGSGYGFRIANGVDNVTIEGFIIRNYGTGPESAGQSAGVAAINTTVDPTTAITVSHNRFEGINWAGVFFFNTGQSTYQDVIIDYNVITMGPWALDTNVYGIECTNCTNATIANNEVSGGSNGIVLSAQGTVANPVTAAGNAIVNNTVSTSDEGTILLMSYDPSWADGAPLLQDTRIEGNTLTNDGTLGTQGNSAILVYSHENGRLDGLDVTGNSITVNNPDNIPLDLATTANIDVDANTITIQNPAVDGRVLYMNCVGGSHINVLDNLVTIGGTTTADYFHAVDLNGGDAPGVVSRNGSAVWSVQHPFPLSSSVRPQAVTSRPGFQGARISGNTFTGSQVGAHSAAIRLRETLPATATISVLTNTISGFYSGIWPNAPQNFFVRDNVLTQNAYGINTAGTGVKLGMIATGNDISENSTTGILFSASGTIPATLGGSIATANTFSNNGPGGGSNLVVDLPVTNPIIEAFYNNWTVTDVCDIGARIQYLTTPGLVNFYDIEAEADPTTALADGVSASDITGRLIGLYAPAGNAMQFTTTLGTLNPETGIADTLGEAHSDLTSTVTGTAVVSATAGAACLPYSEVATIPIPVIFREGGMFFAYLPLILRHYPLAPDLVVTDLAATGYGITVTIENQGGRPVLDAFWVDAYIDPDTAPQAVNELWMYVGDEGLAWGIEGDALPMLPGDVLTLTMNDLYYWPEYSTVITWPIPAGTPIYAQVDSGNPATTYGAILEQHEIDGDAYNNIMGPITVAAGRLRQTVDPERSARPHRDTSTLPPRPQIQD